jgi:hypothetical protein
VCGVSATTVLPIGILKMASRSLTTVRHERCAFRSSLRPTHVLKFVTSALFLRRHIATCLLSRDTIFSKLGMYPKRVQNISYLDRYYPVSQDYCVFLSVTKLYTRGGANPEWPHISRTSNNHQPGTLASTAWRKVTGQSTTQILDTYCFLRQLCDTWPLPELVTRVC